MVLVPPVLVWAPAPSELASVTAQVMVRLVLVAVGSSLVLLNCTERKAVWYCAIVAVPAKVNTPVPLLYAPLMPLALAKLSTSPAVRPALIVTVAPAICASSASLSVMPPSIFDPEEFSA